MFIIGATNRPDLLDPAILRPGRLDRLIYLGVANSEEHQSKACRHAAPPIVMRAQVLHALTRKFPLDPAFDMAGVVSQLKPNFTGADLYALCSDAMLCAIKRCIATSSSAPQVSNADFAQALQTLTPSVSMDELLRYDQLAAQFVVK